MNILLTIISAVVGYLLGDIPVGVVISRLYGGVDIRKTGSGNSGTTNVLRTLGWLPSVLTLVGDCLKGVLAALIGKWIGGEAGMLAGGFFAVLGHDFPAFMGFRGGKGIATSLGITIVICPAVAPWLVIITLPIVAVTRIMSAGTLAASLSYPFLIMLLRPEGSDAAVYLVFAIAMAALSFFCHRSNIMRLIRGQENKLDFAKISRLSEKYRNLRKSKKQ